MNNCVYIIECNDLSYYTGWTNDLEKRFSAHNSGRGAKYTRGRLPLKIVHVEYFDTKSECLKREIEIKKMSRPTKKKLIENAL